MSVRPFLDKHPQLGARVYVDPQACVIGEVSLGEDASVWPMAVVRGDVNSIVIGARTNIQDAAVIHVTHEGPFTRVGGWPTVIGVIVALATGASITMATIAFAAQRYFELSGAPG